MLARWVRGAGLAALFLALVGCRKTLPDLKPAPAPEVLNPPPMESRFSNPVYPRQAFQDRQASPLRKLEEPIMPARGPGGMGPGGMGGYK